MDYSFDIKAERKGAVPWLKEYFTPDAVRQQDMLGYSGAEFEFATCPAYIKGVVEAAQKGVFGFTLVRDAYRNAIKWWLEELRDYQIDPVWIVPTQGTIFSLATAIRLVTQPKENIIVLNPNYNRYNQAAERLHRGTVSVALKVHKGEYSIDWESLTAAFANPANKLLVLCNPNNPTGHTYSAEDLQRIAELSKQYDVLVFSDEIFGDVVFEGHCAIPYTKIAGPSALAITCTSMGKVFSLTGVNHANVIIENETLRQKYIEQRDADHFGSVDPMTYAGMVSAYTQEGKDWVLVLREYVWGNYQLLERFMATHLPKAVITRPHGSFVVWVDYSAYGERWEELDRILRKKGLFVGDEGEEYYGPPTCVRYSIAVPRAELEKTLSHVKNALSLAKF